MNELSMFQSLASHAFQLLKVTNIYKKNFQNEGLGNFGSLTVAGSR